MTLRITNGMKLQAGTTAVEFAMIAVVFFTVLFGIMETGRLLWAWNAGAEATRLGARLAVVCSMDRTYIASRMQEGLPMLAVADIDIDYLNPPELENTCTVDNCKSVRVSLNGYTYLAIFPFVPISVPIPPFQTTLPREGMNSSGNPICS